MQGLHKTRSVSGNNRPYRDAMAHTSVVVLGLTDLGPHPETPKPDDFLVSRPWAPTGFSLFKPRGSKFSLL